MIYLDNAATTFPKPKEVYDVVDYFQRNMAVNIGRGSYKAAAEAMKIVDETRELLTVLVNGNNPSNVIITPSATIAANEIILGLKWDEYKTVYISPFEHNALMRPLEHIKEKFGVRVFQLPFDSETQEFDFGKAKTMFLNNPPDYVFLNHVSNVTGVILPVEKIFSLAKSFNAVTILDAAQSAGLIDIDMNRDSIDYLIFAGHKNLYSSWGIGGFISNSDPMLDAVIFGGTGSNSLDLSMGDLCPTKFEPASPNIIAIASLHASLKWLEQTSIKAVEAKKKSLVDILVQGLQDQNCKVYTPRDMQNHTSVVSFNVPGYLASEIGEILSADFDIAVRTGYHCAPYVHSFLGTNNCGGTVRASVGFFNEETDINKLLYALKEL